MTHADRLHRWNTWYERVPEDWRFQLLAWALVVVGAVNMLLTIAIGFPFALLLVLAIAAMAAVRMPWLLGWVSRGDAGAGPARIEVEAPAWVHDANRWYEGLPETRRPFVILAALAIPGAINMALTIGAGFPFGLLFLLALLALVAIRAPYAAGWLKPPAASASATAALPAGGMPAISLANHPPPLTDGSAARSGAPVDRPVDRPAQP